MRWLLLVAVLVALLVAGDRVAEHVAEGVLADRLTAELGSRPSVEVDGFPFLTQVVRGRYGELKVSAGTVERGAVDLQAFTATLSGVRAPLTTVVGGSLRAVPVHRLVATGLVPYAELAAVADRGLDLAPDPVGVRVSGTVRVLGRDVRATAVSSVAVEDDAVVVTAQRLEVGGVAATGPVAAALAGRLDLRLRLPRLPYDVQLRSVQAGPLGITVSGSADDLVLTS